MAAVFGIPRHARRLAVTAYAVLVTAIGFDLSSGPHWTASPVLAAAPVLAGVGTRRARIPLTVGLAALVLVALLGAHDRSVPLLDHLTSGFAVLATTCISAANVVLVATRERELVRSRSVAEAAQLALLRPVPERVGGLRVAVRYLAAAADARVGGDLYEVLETPCGIRLIIGDVRGKGLSAVETAADVLGSFREAAQVEADLGTVARRLDAAVRQRGGGEEFVTAALLGIAQTEAPVELVNCGHPPPLRKRGEEVTPLRTQSSDSAPPLALRYLADGPYDIERFAFGKDDLLVLYTDGVTEARNANGDFYPLESRLSRMPESSPDALADHLVADLLAHAGGTLQDDAALLVIRRQHRNR
ncbi:PP2C family protein-serine/threonine phosphatase [Streptomyces sp. NPDC001678]|uniref:PP2C family protein-serine/threonine phosphatase n=1 Tax=Streptomyces sp. NPDC001678 TaxID=3364599 RepID=UPI0036CF615F